MIFAMLWALQGFNPRARDGREFGDESAPGVNEFQSTRP